MQADVQSYLGPSLDYHFHPAIETPIPAESPAPPPAKKRVQVGLGQVGSAEDAYSLPVVVPAYDPAEYFRLRKILVKYAPAEYVPAQETVEWWLAYTAAPTVELDPPAPGSGGTVRGRLDQELEGAYVVRVILQAAAA